MTDAWTGEPGWPRPRHVRVPGRGPSLQPACFVQRDPAEPLSADPARLQRCYAELLCQVCGEPALSVDPTAWVLSPAANMGGACCTRCMYLAVRTCPHLAEVPDGAFEICPVTRPEDYDWHLKDGMTDGHVEPSPANTARLSWQEYLQHYNAWKRS